MANNSRLTQTVTSILFSLIVTTLLGFGGLLLGWFLWGHFGPPTLDPDEPAAYAFGLVLGAIIGLAGGVASLWRFWPRSGEELKN